MVVVGLFVCDSSWLCLPVKAMLFFKLICFLMGFHLSTSAVPEVCFSSQDCFDRSVNVSGNHVATETSWPLFCQGPVECLCNQMRISPNGQPPECVQCRLKPFEDFDPCNAQDPFSLCNAKTGFCECSPVLIDTRDQTNQSNKAWSICLHQHLHGHRTQLVPSVEYQPSTADLILTAFLAYILPFSIIIAFICYAYTHFCKFKLASDSEMILYQQL